MKPNDRAAKSRRAILDAACPIFMENGYARASLNQIIRASGLTKGGFYFHFPSKLALALAAVADSQEGYMSAVLDEVARYPTAAQRLFEVPRLMARLELETPTLGAFNRLVAELSQDPTLRPEACGSLRFSIDGVADQIREAQTEGSVRADVDPEEMAEVCVGGFMGMQSLTDQLGDGRLMERVEALISTVQSAILTKAHGNAGSGPA